MASSNIRYGPGVTQEIGMDLANMNVKHVGVYTDKNLIELPAMKVVLDSLHNSNINYKVFDDVRVEPTDQRYLRYFLDLSNGKHTQYDNMMSLNTYNLCKRLTFNINYSFISASDFAKKHQFDAFLAVGGGSVIDTCKAANLYSSDPSAEFLDYVNAPIGKGNYFYYIH